MKHSPGPWKVEYYSWVRAADGEAVCHGIGEIKYGRTVEAQLLLAEANARLIAAAPDLLEAAKYAMAECVDLIATVPGNLLEKAIAKAEGKE